MTNVTNISEKNVLVPSKLSLFSTKPVLKGFERTVSLTIPPRDGWREGNVIEFELPFYSTLCMDASSFRVNMVLQIKNGDGTDPDDTTQFYAPINGIGILLFSYITSSINGVLISGENRYDVFKNYLELLLSNSVDAKSTYFKEGCIWLQDTAGRFNDVAKESKNKGFLSRFQIFNGKSQVHTSAAIPYPLAQSNLLLNPGFNLKFTFAKGSDQFNLMTNTPEKAMKIEINKIWITAKGYAIDPPIFNSLNRQLQTEDSRYNFIRSAISGPYQLSTEQKSFSYTIFRNNAPLTCLLFFNRVDSCGANYSLNPLEMLNPFITNCYVEIEGTKYPTNGYVIPGPYSPDPNSAQSRSVYLEIYRILSQENGITSGLEFYEFLNQYHFVVFQISDNLPSDLYRVDQKTGDTKLYFELNENPTQPLNLFCIGTFDSTILVSNTNGVLKNYPL